MTKTYYTPQPDEFYTYIYWRTDKSPSEPFYVGKGKNDRAWKDHSHSSYFTRISNKLKKLRLNPEITVAYHGPSEHRAFQAERLMISLYGRKDLGEGPLVNKTNGGEGASGYIHSDNTRAKMSVAQKGNTKCLGRTLSVTHKIKIGDSNRGNKNGCYGKQHSSASIDKMSLAHRGKIQSNETKARISASLRGRTLSSEHKERVSLSKMNPSLETRAKISAARKAYWKRKRLEGVAVDERR